MRRTIYLVLTAMAVMMLLCGCGSKTETTETNQTTEVESEEVKEIESDTDDFVDDYAIESLYLLAAMQEKFGENFNVYDAYEFECNGVEYIVYGDQMVSADDIYETACNLMQNEM